MTDYKPPLVISIHGIRTHAKWQKTLADTLSQCQIPHKSYDYDFFPLHQFLNKAVQLQMVDQFRNKYHEIISRPGIGIDIDDACKRPSIIAHSFGTYIVAYSMQKYDDIKLDKLILCGSILPKEFDWKSLLEKRQVNQVYHEFGGLDIWMHIVRWFVPKTGDSGRKGFAALYDYPKNKFVQKEYPEFKHSDYLSERHFTQNWLPILRNPNVYDFRHSRALTDNKSALSLAIKSMLAMDNVEFYTDASFDDVKVTENHVYSWLEINADIYTLLYKHNRKYPVGYINAVPVDESTFQKIKEGKLQDGEIAATDILPFEAATTHCMFIMSVVIDRNERMTKGLTSLSMEKLIEGFVDKLVYYTYEHGVKITEIAAVGWTDVGKSLAKVFGMKQVASDKYGHPVFVLDLQDPALNDKPIARRWLRRLLVAYNDVSKTQ